RSAQWPLPRRTYAAIIARLNRAGAHTIALDVLFPAPSPYPADDAALARVCRQAGNVVQAVAFHLRNTQNSLPSSELRAIAPPPSRFQIVPHNAGMREADQMTPLPPSLLSSAPALGHLNVYPESDGVLRRLPHLIKYRGAAFPSLALAAATHFLGRKPA